MDKFTVQAFIRDDGKKLEIDESQIFLADENDILVNAEAETSDMEYTEQNGGEMIRQRLMIGSQSFAGIIRPVEDSYQTLMSKLRGFFQINHTYQVIYRAKDGATFSRDGAWIESTLQIQARWDELFSYWNIGFKFGETSLKQYAEGSDGARVSANNLEIGLAAGVAGGEVWDEIGEVWDDIGTVWEAGEGGIRPVSVESTGVIYPVWTVRGEAVRPSIQNNTTDTVATFEGTVSAGQTLVVDFASGRATIDGSLVSRLVSGELKMTPGQNMIGFNVDSGTAEKSEISWNNVIG